MALIGGSLSINLSKLTRKIPSWSSSRSPSFFACGVSRALHESVGDTWVAIRAQQGRLLQRIFVFFNIPLDEAEARPSVMFNSRFIYCLPEAQLAAPLD